MSKLTIIILLSFAFSGCCAEMKVDVNSLLVSPSSHSKEVFELNACVESNRHGIYLRDCYSRGGGVDFVFAEGVYGQGESVEFMRVARRGWSSTYEGVLSVKLVGKMERNDSGWVFAIYKIINFSEVSN